MSERLRNWCFTAYNLEDKFTSWRTESLPEDVRYIVYQRERCPDTGRIHLQGYIEFTASYRRRAVQRAISDEDIHVERRQGSRTQARDYCRNADKRVQGFEPSEYGTWQSEQGKRSDLAGVAEEVVNGVSTSSIALEHPATWIRYHRGIESLAAVRDSAVYDFRRVEVLVLWGTTGTGKTRAAFEVLGGEPYVLSLRASGTIWFDGYRGQRSILFDDFYGGIRHGDMLNLLDGHFCQLPVKGGFTYARWNRVVITSNTHPEGWYQSMGLTPAMKRRITWICRLHNSLDFSSDLYEQIKWTWTN